MRRSSFTYFRVVTCGRSQFTLRQIRRLSDMNATLTIASVSVNNNTCCTRPTDITLKRSTCSEQFQLFILATQQYICTFCGFLFLAAAERRTKRTRRAAVYRSTMCLHHGQAAARTQSWFASECVSFHSITFRRVIMHRSFRPSVRPSYRVQYT